MWKMPNTTKRVATHRDHAHCCVVGVCLPVAETNWPPKPFPVQQCCSILEFTQAPTVWFLIVQPSHHIRGNIPIACAHQWRVHLPMMPNRPLVRTVPLTATPSRPSSLAVWRIAARPILCRLECRPTTSLRCPRFQNRGHDNILPTGSVHGAHDVVGATVCTSEQDLPCILQIRNCWDDPAQLPFLQDSFVHLPSNVLLRSGGGAQHCEALRLPCLPTQVADVVRPKLCQVFVLP